MKPIKKPRQNVTLKDIALHCGVGVPTVSRALRDPHRFSAELTKRIHEVAKELGYDPMRQDWARRMSLRRHGKEPINHLIALIFPPRFYAMPFYAAIYQGIIDVLTPEGFSLLTVSSREFNSYPLAPSFCRGDVDGVILTEAIHRLPKITARLREEPSFAARPIVSLFYEYADCLTVRTDYYRGAYEAAAHLLDLGHHHILMIADVENFMVDMPGDTFYERADGYRQAFRDRGLDPATGISYLQLTPELDDRLILSEPHPLQVPSLAHQHGEWLINRLRQSPEITAVVGLNDVVAYFCYETLRQHGIRVPDDISLIGYEDTVPIYNVEGENILTTVQHPQQELGREAVRLLLRHVMKQETKPDQPVIATKLIQRATTAPPAPPKA